MHPVVQSLRTSNVFRRDATFRRSAMSESMSTPMSQYEMGGRQIGGGDKASWPPDSPNYSTALELCSQRPDSAYTAFDLIWGGSNRRREVR